MTDAASADATALVGATGGAGTTRLAVELGTLLAVDGRDVAVLDAAFATQGLADYLAGRIDPDLTALVTDERDAPLADGLLDLPLEEADGRLACCPAAAPFERLARAKSTDAARALESRLREATDAFDHVLVDAPPVAANQAVAAVNAADRVAVVAPATTRGADAVQRVTGRIEDVGAAADAVVTTRGDLPVADAAVPETASEVTAAPTCPTDGALATALVEVADAVLAAEPSAAAERSLVDSLGEYVSR